MMPRFIQFPVKYRILFSLTVSLAFSFLLLSHFVSAEFSEPTPQIGTQTENFNQSNVNANEQPHTLAGSYYSLRNNFSATLMLNNKGALPLSVTPTFFSLNGTPLELAPLMVNAASYREIDLRELLANAPAEFQAGSLQVFYQGMKMQLGAQIKLFDAENSLLFEEQMFVPQMKHISSRLESVWWLPAPNCETKFILSNTTNASVTATVRVDGTSPSQQNPAIIQLNPHETRVLDVIRDVVGNPGGTLHVKGGISISHSGEAGAVLARMLISRPNKGFSSVVNFVDPEMTASSKWNGAGLRLKNLNGDRLNQILVARNIGSAPTTVSGRIPYTNQNGDVVSVTVSSIQIAPNSTKIINLRQILDAANVPSSVSYAGLEFDYSTSRGSVVMAAFSVSQNENHVFQVPLFDPNKTPSSAGGYPWKADGDYATILYIKNDTDTPKKYLARLIYEGGSFVLGEREIKANQTVAIDFRGLRDTQTPDSRGNVIPLNIERGQIAWSIIGRENKTLSGRSEQISVSRGVSSTYDCRNCCPDTRIIDTISPAFADTEIGGSIQYFQIGIITNCYGQETPIQYSAGELFSSNSSIAAINGSFAEGMSLGEATITANWMNISWFEVGPNNCWMDEYPGQGSGDMTVGPRVRISGAQTKKDGETASFNVTVQDGVPIGYLWTFEAPNGAGNNPNVTFTSPNTDSTMTDAHWFARPNQACPPSSDPNHSYYNSRYTIKAKVTFQGGREITKDTTLTVNAYWSPAGYVAPPSISGGPIYGFDPQRNLWVITGPGNMQRALSPRVINVPSTSQFYNKTVQHEQKHEAQYATGMLSDLFTVNSLFSVLSTITNTSEAGLLNNVNQATINWYAQQSSVLQGRLPAAEREAFDVSDPIAPQYIYQNCGRY